MKILFVCKQNRFRSQIAEQFFKKYNKNKKISAQSGGLIRGSYPLYEPEVNTVKLFGINIDKVPESISVDLIKKKIDLVVITAWDIPKDIFMIDGKYWQKVIKWEIKDDYTGNIENIKRIIGEIEVNIKNLIKELDEENDN
ncbi:MAG: hypothetical protein AABX26_02950 [Nanoarchaeota archaeon]